MNINAYSSDAEIRKYLKRKKRRRLRIRIASRLGAMIVIFLMMIYLIVTGIQAVLIPDTHAADVESGVDVRGTIFVDAGHGAEDPGAEDMDRVEKYDTLDMALAVRKSLRKLGFKVVMSRTEDTWVDRKERALMANDCKAALMVSIHRNSAKSGQGWEMYIPSEDGAEERLLGENIMSCLEDVGITENRGVRAGTLKDPADDYSENKYSTMPSVLIECGFLSDAEDNAMFDNKMYDYADAIAQGVSDTYAELFESE